MHTLDGLVAAVVADRASGAARRTRDRPTGGVRRAGTDGAVGWGAVPDLPSRPAGFPVRRLRRLRRTPALRRLVAETALSVDDLVAPLFVADGLDAPRPVGSLPGVSQHTVDSAGRRGHAAWPALGVPGVILFALPRPEDKDATGSAALDPDGITRRAIDAVRDAVGDDWW